MEWALEAKVGCKSLAGDGFQRLLKQCIYRVLLSRVHYSMILGFEFVNPVLLSFS